MRNAHVDLEDHGRAVQDQLVRLVERHGICRPCPHCDGWIHFTIRSKRAITPDEAAQYPQLPDDWHARANPLAVKAAPRRTRPP